MDLKTEAAAHITAEFGKPPRDVVKVKSWVIAPGFGLVLQKDAPNKENGAFVWLPYPDEGKTVPEIAFEYPGEAGRHSGTYACPGLERGKPALKLTVRSLEELRDVIQYAKAIGAGTTPPRVEARQAPGPGVQVGAEGQTPIRVDVASMPKVEPVKARREAIPRSVQREVWQRDGGQCVECKTREKLCFDHIVPFSRGGSNSIRNLQLLCEGCNLAKSNRI